MRVFGLEGRAPRRSPSLVLLFALLLAPSARAADVRPLEFHVVFDRAVSAEPFTGRVYVLLTRQQPSVLSGSPSWFNPPPFFSVKVKDVRPGDRVVLGADAVSYPMPPAKVARGVWYAQAVMDFDRGSRQFSTAEGNGYSKPARLDIDPATAGPVALVIDQVYYAQRTFAETDRVKLVDLESKLLSEFHHTPVHLRAGVVLPRSFASNPEKRYPVVYEIPGFGGDHFGAARQTSATDVAGVEMIRVVLDANCRWGHHVFANSDNNGPCGQALIEELIPYIEKKYRALGVPTARFVTGHSSGGWSSLWLQAAYPDFFGGVWSTAPDPVDFRDFQRINIYRPGENMFTDEAGKPRPLARRGGEATLFYRGFSDMEEVMGHGGQLRSFEAVFSPRGADGEPKRLWNRRTGAIDPDIARTWERYDIRLLLERNWAALGPKLAGKLHVYCGDMDTYYLNGAVALLKESQHQLKSDAVVELFPGKDHSTLMDRNLRERIAREMADQFRTHYRP